MLALPLGLLNSARFVRFMHEEADLLVMALIGHVILVSFRAPYLSKRGCGAANGRARSMGSRIFFKNEIV
jgi:hypothetical protein